MYEKLINKTIAKFDGWTFKEGNFCPWISPNGTAWTGHPTYTQEFHRTKGVLRKLDQKQRRQFIINLCRVCDRDFGNREVDPSDVLDPNEMSQMFLIDCSDEQLAEALYLTIKKG